MYLIAIAWMYVVVMMSVAEATASNGTVLGAFITFFLYGVLPCVILLYLMGTPMRRKAIRAKERTELEAFRAQAEATASSSATTLSPDASSAAPNSSEPDAGRVSDVQPDAGREAPADAIPSVRKEV